MNRRLGALTWPEVRVQGGGTILAVPVGSTEQHGPHLPLSTDTDIAVALAELLSAHRPAVLVAPAVAYGSSGEHAGFAGTLSIGREAIELLLVELGRSASESFQRMLIVSAHGGNEAPVRGAAERLSREGRDVRVFSPQWPGDAHAGRVETSLMLALRPGLVRLQAAAAGARGGLGELLPRLIRGGVAEVSPNGVLGDPAGACAEEGTRLLEDGVRELCDLVDRWRERDPAEALG